MKASDDYSNLAGPRLKSDSSFEDNRFAGVLLPLLTDVVLMDFLLEIDAARRERPVTELFFTDLAASLGESSSASESLGMV